jgi:6-phospho-3-hexuloisomerase
MNSTFASHPAIEPSQRAFGQAAVYAPIASGREAAPRAKERPLTRAIELLLAENRSVLKRIDHWSVEALASAIVGAKRIFVAGEGRSGLAVRMAAMRLVHLGCHVHVVGETTTPSLTDEDLFVVVSGSGKTAIVSIMASAAKAAGASVVAITTQPDSPIAKMADLVVTIEAAAKQDRSGQHSKQFAGSLFEQATLLLFDALFHVLSLRQGKSADSLWRLHTNVE